MTEDQSILVDRYLLELLNNADYAKADEILSPDFVFYGPSTRQGLDSRGFIRFMSEIRKAFSNKRFTEIDRIAEGNRVALRFRMTGTQDGSYFGVPPMGGSIDVEGCDLIRISDGKIAEIRAYFDLITIFETVLIPPPVRIFAEMVQHFWPR